MITAHGGSQNRDFSRIMDPKKKLDSEKNGLLSFGEIAVDRASTRARWVTEGAVGS